MLFVYNTLTRQKERFEPLIPGKVGLYVCGITPYDDWHIGNARSAVVFDAVLRHLKASDYDVTFVRNVTDIEDRIINKVKETGEPWQAIVERHTAGMHADQKALNNLTPDHETYCTDYVPQIITMIETLITTGHAYLADNQDVYYAVNTFKEYGKLSRCVLEDQQSETRVEANPHKRDAHDFALWKAAKPGEPTWPSPWGDGRPGWHIECSAMSTDVLGPSFDIHAGGNDLVFPHHENEIAQSEAATGQPFAKYWLHNGMLDIDGTKMSKSLGNFFSVPEVLNQYAPEVVRFFLLSGHYRNPLNYSDQDLDNAKAGLSRLYTALRGTEPALTDDFANYKERFMAAMDDDFNTPQAYAVLFDLAKTMNKWRDEGKHNDVNRLAGRLQQLGGQLGLLYQDPDAFLQSTGRADELPVSEIETQIAARLQAKADKDFTKADAIRDALVEQGVVLEDQGATTTWRRA